MYSHLIKGSRNGVSMVVKDAFELFALDNMGREPLVTVVPPFNV
jgi:hypothetical protein